MFFVKNTQPASDAPIFPANPALTRTQATLLSLGLLYLAIPNSLFLWGWFVPGVACTVSALIIIAILRAVLAMARSSTPTLSGTTGNKSAALILWLLGALLPILVVAMDAAQHGLLGFTPTNGDLLWFRQALFCNLRDAAWPVVLPNGKEMSYYLAGVLPSALIARLIPEHSQWVITLWTAIPVLLALLLLSSHPLSNTWKWGTRLIIITLFLYLFCSPVTLGAQSRFVQLIEKGAALLQQDIAWIFPEQSVMAPRLLSAITTTFNFAPAALLVSAMVICCRRRAETVLPVALALLVPLSPFAGLGLLPLVGVRVIQAWKDTGIRFCALACDMLLPAAMFIISAVYFTRANGESAATLAGIAYGWESFWKLYAWLIISQLVLILPLLFVVRKDAFFGMTLLCILLLPALYIGSMSSPGHGGNNELLLKTAPSYLLIIACYWIHYWNRLGVYKYLILLACIAMTTARLHSFSHEFGSHAYLQVDDKWNGHLCHGDAFLNQSVPHCKEPLIPGLMLRQAGASEQSLPGKLLPAAPGCDYSRPSRSEQP